MKKIVVQESDEAVLDVLILALKMEGFEVIPVQGSVKDCLDLIITVQPQIVLLEHELHGKWHMNLAHQIKQKCPNLPVIAMSCDSSIHKEYIEEGFDDYIRKPFDLDFLYDLLKSHLYPNEHKR